MQPSVPLLQSRPCGQTMPCAQAGAYMPVPQPYTPPIHLTRNVIQQASQASQASTSKVATGWKNKLAFFCQSWGQQDWSQCDHAVRKFQADISNQRSSGSRTTSSGDPSKTTWFTKAENLAYHYNHGNWSACQAMVDGMSQEPHFARLLLHNSYGQQRPDWWTL